MVQGNGSGGTAVNLYETNLVTGVHTLLTGTTLTAAQMANNTQIELDLAHNTANTQAITGSFELFDNGTQTFADTFSTTATEFGSSTFVRAGVFASSSPSVGLTGAAREGATLTAVAVTNDSDATINYQWEESTSPSFTTFTDIGTNSATYVVQEADVGSFIRVVGTTSDPDNSQSATATSQATGAIAAVAPSLSVSGVTLSEDNSAGFPITITPFNPNDPIEVTISGIPGDVSLSDSSGPLTVSNGSITLTPAQLAGLTLHSGQAESATLTITATNEAGATASTTQLVNLNVTPVAPTISISPASISVNEDGTAALPIGVTPFDPRDNVSVVIGGIPSGDTLSDGDGDTFAGGGLPTTMTLAQFDSGVSLTVGSQIPATPLELTVQAYNNSNGVAIAPEQFLAVTVDPVAPTLNVASNSLSVNEDGSVALGIGETPFDPNDTVSITISGVPSDATLSAGTNNGNGSWTLTPAQLTGLSLTAGEVTTANLTITATNTAGATASSSQNIALTVNPVAPSLTAPTSLAVNAGSSVALNLSETPFDPRDTVSITIAGVPADATLSAGTNNGNGTWTLTPAQLAGLTLNAGNATVATLTVTATNTQGATASISDNIALTVNPTLALSVSAAGGGNTQGPGGPDRGRQRDHRRRSGRCRRDDYLSVADVEQRRCDLDQCGGDDRRPVQQHIVVVLSVRRAGRRQRLPRSGVVQGQRRQRHYDHQRADQPGHRHRADHHPAVELCAGRVQGRQGRQHVR